MRADFKPERAGFGVERVDFGPERFYFEYERTEFKLVTGGRDRLKKRGTDIRKFTPVFYGTSVLWGRCPNGRGA